MYSLKTPAKINLFLSLRGQRADGYHEVCFVMQSVALFDTLTLTPEPDSPGIRFTCSQPGITDNPDDNLVVKAYHSFFQVAGIPPMGMSVHLEKHIPVQAGLGGGSSDAAAMLRLLNDLPQQVLSFDSLSAIAAALGSDVPFFLSGGTALATGRGEIITPLEHPLPTLPLLMIKPRRFGISTPIAYQAIRDHAQYQTLAVEPFLEHLPRIQSSRDLAPFLANDFETVLFQRYPALDEIRQQMLALGIQRPLLSGSGPAMIGFYEPDVNLRATVASQFPDSAFEVFWSETLSSPRIAKVLPE